MDSGEFEYYKSISSVETNLICKEYRLDNLHSNILDSIKPKRHDCEKNNFQK